MELGLFGRLVAFQDLLDQVDAAARSVELITEQLVGRTGRGAESAMHACTQDRFRLLAFRRVLDEVR
jgi:hypothetical protein